MNNKQPCITSDSYYLQASAEGSFNNPECVKYQVSDGEKEPPEDWGNGRNFSKAENCSFDALENGKRHCIGFCGELVNKRAKKEGQSGNFGFFAGNSSICGIFEEKAFPEDSESKIQASVVDAEAKCPAPNLLYLTNATCNMLELDTSQSQPARASYFTGYDFLDRNGLNRLEDHLHRRFLPIGLDPRFRRRCVPIGLGHQADLPRWTRRYCKSSDSHSELIDGTSSSVFDGDALSDEKWLGTCIIPLPKWRSTPTQARVCCSKEDCYCADEGSIRCVRQHVAEARERLSGSLGKQKFVELGFPDMGEDVAGEWSEEAENLFHMVVLSNSASSGRNFWSVLPRAFPWQSFKHIVSYYFNVFVLRKRATQNRIDPLNADSDDDEWQESSDDELELSDEEGEDSMVESLADGNSLSIENNVSDNVDDEDKCENHLVGIENEGSYNSGYKPMHCMELIDRKSRSRYCSFDHDVQDDSCTSFEGPSYVEGDQKNLHGDNRNDCVVDFVKYDYIDGRCDSKLWEINYIGATEKGFDFFPTCNVIEEVFGKACREDDVRDG